MNKQSISLESAAKKKREYEMMNENENEWNTHQPIEELFHLWLCVAIYFDSVIQALWREKNTAKKKKKNISLEFFFFCTFIFGIFHHSNWEMNNNKYSTINKQWIFRCMIHTYDISDHKTYGKNNKTKKKSIQYLLYVNLNAVARSLNE